MTLQSLELLLADQAMTERLGERLAALAQRHDVITLSGDIGIGKTVLARAFIGALTGETDVPSPTFTLVQTYEAPLATIWHFDLYRLKSPHEIWEIGLEEALAEGILLIEWPERMDEALPSRRLDVGLTAYPDGDERLARLTPGGLGWADRLRNFASL